MELKKISDLGLVAYLQIMGIMPVKKEQEGRFLVFYFELTPELTQEIENFLNNNSSVDAQTIIDKFRRFRMMAVDGRR
jgi:ribosomal protein S6